MNDIINILNLNPAFVQSCSCADLGHTLVYKVTLKRNEISCSSCSAKLKIKDYTTKMIHNQIIRGKNTKIEYRARRYYCPICHTSYYERNPFSNSRTISYHTKIEVMKALKEHNSTFASVARQMYLPHTTVMNIFDELGHMNRLPLPTALCIDEVFVMRKTKFKYACVLMNFETGEVIDVIKGRTKNAWASYMQLIPKEEWKKVKYMSIDMFETYRSIKNIYFPSSVLAVDSFHIISNINKILHDVRIKIMKRYESNSIEYYLLKKFNWLLMKDAAVLPDHPSKYNKKLQRYINYHQLRELILEIDPLLNEAYRLKEDYLLLNQTANYENIRDRLGSLIVDYKNSSIEAYSKFSDTLIHWFDEICNSFIYIDGRRISNGRIESANSRVKTILKVANGYSNFSRLRNKILFCVNRSSVITSHSKPINIKRKMKQRGKYKTKNPSAKV